MMHGLHVRLPDRLSPLDTSLPGISEDRSCETVFVHCSVYMMMDVPCIAAIAGRRLAAAPETRKDAAALLSMRSLGNQQLDV